MFPLEAVLFALLLGIYIGYAFREPIGKLFSVVSNRPARLKPNTKFEAEVNVIEIEPPHRLPMWITRTHAYIMRGELCKPESPLNVREMRELTGLSWRQQGKYLDVLEQGRVVQIVSGVGVRWAVNKRTRRRMLNRLPYPRDVDPPAF